MRNTGKFIPLITGFAVLLLLILVVYFECIKLTGGKFIYILDDAYIHLAFVKNIVLHNVWGITQYENSSSSSSPLWTLILTAVFTLSGVNEFIPLAINILLSFILITIIFLIFRKYSLPDFYIAITIISVIIISPLAINIFTGMEHILQTIFVIVFIFFSVKILIKSSPVKNHIAKEDLIIFILSALTTSVRYEDIFGVIIVSSLFFIRKKFLSAFLIILSGMIPLLIFGLISLNNGGYIIPNSVLVKTILPESVRVFTEGNIYRDLSNYLTINKKIIFLFIVSLILLILQLRLKKKFWSEIPLLLFVILSIIVLHKISFSFSHFRYDAYLVIISIVINAIAFYDYIAEKYHIRVDFEYIRKSKAALAGFIIFSFFLIYKSFDSKYILTASKNIYEQQYQMSRFINKYYAGTGVALNDVGAVNFFADIRCTDLIGVGSNEIAEKKWDGSFETKDMEKIAESKNLKIAILYDSWFIGNSSLQGKPRTIPALWKKAGEWKIQNNYICGDDEVSMYAIDPEAKEELIRNLRSFSNELPVSVIQSGEYIQK